MDASRLLWTLEALIGELQENPPDNSIGALETAIGQKQPPDSLRAVLQSAEDVLGTALSNRLPPSRRAVLSIVGGEKLFGKALAAKLRAVATEYDIRPDHAAAELGGIRQELKVLESRMTAAAQSLRKIGIEPDQVPPSMCEIGVLYPEGFAPTLDDFQEELKELDKHLRLITEIHGQAGSSRVHMLSTSSWDVFVNVVSIAGVALLLALDRILASIKKVRELRVLGLEIERREIDLGVASKLSDAQEEAREKGLKEAVEELLRSATVSDAGRRNELNNGARLVALYLATRVEEGVIFEAWVPPEQETEKEGSPEVKSQSATLARIRELGGLMNELVEERKRSQIAAPSQSEKKRSDSNR